MFRSSQLTNYMTNYDLICLTETHTIQAGKINFNEFKIFEFPDTDCNFEYPRGGICLLIKKDKMQYIKHARLLMTDFIEIKFVNGLTMINLYVPPADSVYYDEQYVQLLASEFCEATKTKILCSVWEIPTQD